MATKLVSYTIISFMAIIAIAGIVLFFSEPLETLPVNIWWTTLLWTKVLGAVLLAFDYFIFKWMIKYSKKLPITMLGVLLVLFTQCNPPIEEDTKSMPENPPEWISNCNAKI